MKKKFYLYTFFAGTFIFGSLCGCGKDTSIEEEPTIKAESVIETVADGEPVNEAVEETNEEASATEVEATYVSPIMSALDNELDLIEIESTFLQDEIGNEELSNSEINKISNEWYTLWDDELNSLWSRFWDEADKKTRDSALEEQRSWISTKEEKANTEASKYEDTAKAENIKIQTRAKLTRLRSYEIASMLGKLIDQNVILPSSNYEGLYVDTQGTNEIYSDLSIVKAEDDFYDVEIGLFRLTTLYGYATLENGILKFVDENLDVNIKGDILIDNDSATFTITESEFTYLNPGDYFTFDEKWDD